MVFDQPRFSAVDVPSGVSAQPWGDDETVTGAYNRAQEVLDTTSADLGVGLEGGVIETRFGLMTCAWCVLLRRDGTAGIGGGAKMLLPPSVATDVRAGMELGHAMDQLIGEQNTKHKAGAIGILTNNLLDRQTAYENIIQLAAAPFRQPDYYQNRGD